MKKGHIFRGEAPSTEKQLQFVEEFPYAEAVGAVLYLSVITRFDIAYSVGVLTWHMKRPTFEACLAMCRLLLYLKKTKNRGLRYHGTSLNLRAFTDSDWAGDLDTRRSTSGYVVMMANGPISWLSKLQAIVAASSMEAEYIACFFAIQEVLGFVLCYTHWVSQEQDLLQLVLLTTRALEIWLSIRFIVSGLNISMSSSTGFAIRLKTRQWSWRKWILRSSGLIFSPKR